MKCHQGTEKHKQDIADVQKDQIEILKMEYHLITKIKNSTGGINGSIRIKIQLPDWST